MAFPGFCALLFLGAAALAETKVEIKGVHLCCGACVKGVGTALKGIDGIKPACDREKGTVTITATDDATAQKALDALAAAGYHGDTGNKDLAIKAETNVPKGKVQSLSLTNAHNCCQSCCKAIKSSVKKVDGVAGDTAKPKTADFQVTGDFDAAEVVKALNDAGFHVQVKP
ncbi:MAG: hypothetical protein P4L84_06965 [Isosphaeraceae bacterium]|nr:hypothetical protein [Isosphaeraceae bacterium]